MPSNPNRRRPTVEALEGRLALSAPPLDTLSVVGGTVSAPGSVAEVSVPIAPQNLVQHKPSTLIGLSIAPTPGTNFDPTIVSVTGPNGHRLPLRYETPASLGTNGQATVFTFVNQPGPITITVAGLHHTTGGFGLRSFLPGDLNGSGTVTLADEKLFTTAFETHIGDGYYNPAADANQNGQIGIVDAKMLLRNLTPLTPNIHLRQGYGLELRLSPADQVAKPMGSDSGGETSHANVTILGHAIPGSMVFTDDSFGFYNFNNQAIAPDAQGNFSLPVTLSNRLTTINFLMIDPYGQQTIRSFPIVYFKPGPS